MIIDVSSILKEMGGKIGISGDISLADTDFLGELYHFDKPFHIEGSIQNNGKSLYLKAVCSGALHTKCARCAKDIDVDVVFDAEEALAQANGVISEDSDIILFDGTEIDIDDIVLNSFLMNISGKYLCSEDCKGLCPQCGADLNEGDCGCSHDVIDPRWAALADLMKDNN